VSRPIHTDGRVRLPGGAPRHHRTGRRGFARSARARAGVQTERATGHQRSASAQQLARAQVSTFFSSGCSFSVLAHLSTLFCCCVNACAPCSMSGCGCEASPTLVMGSVAVLLLDGDVGCSGMARPSGM
jgi:hypothetical protein